MCDADETILFLKSFEKTSSIIFENSCTHSLISDLEFDNTTFSLKQHSNVSEDVSLT